VLAKLEAYRPGEGTLFSSPEAIPRARRILGAAAVLSLALVAGVALLGTRSP
jgi:hypothetical protein